MPASFAERTYIPIFEGSGARMHWRYEAMEPETCFLDLQAKQREFEGSQSAIAPTSGVRRQETQLRIVVQATGHFGGRFTRV